MACLGSWLLSGLAVWLLMRSPPRQIVITIMRWSTKWGLIHQWRALTCIPGVKYIQLCTEGTHLKCPFQRNLCYTGCLFLARARCNSVEEHLLMVWWVVGSILDGGPKVLFLIPANALWLVYVLSYKRFPLSLSEWCFTICPTLYNRK